MEDNKTGEGTNQGNQDNKDINDGLVDKFKNVISEMFNKKAEDKKDEIDLSSVKSLDELPDNIKKLVAEAVSTEVTSTVNIIAGKVKQKTAEEEKQKLEAERLQIEKDKQELALNSKLISLGVDERFYDFIKHSIGTEGSVEDFLTKNPQYIKNTHTQNSYGQGNTPTPDELKYLKMMRR